MRGGSGSRAALAGTAEAFLAREWHTVVLTVGVALLVPLFVLAAATLPDPASNRLAPPALEGSSVTARLPDGRAQLVLPHSSRRQEPAAPARRGVVRSPAPVEGDAGPRAATSDPVSAPARAVGPLARAEQVLPTAAPAARAVESGQGADRVGGGGSRLAEEGVREGVPADGFSSPDAEATLAEDGSGGQSTAPPLENEAGQTSFGQPAATAEGSSAETAPTESSVETAEPPPAEGLESGAAVPSPAEHESPAPVVGVPSGPGPTREDGIHGRPEAPGESQGASRSESGRANEAAHPSGPSADAGGSDATFAEMELSIGDGLLPGAPSRPSEP